MFLLHASLAGAKAIPEPSFCDLAQAKFASYLVLLRTTKYFWDIDILF